MKPFSTCLEEIFWIGTMKPSTKTNSQSQKRGIISLMPKSEVTCWRPITPLNVVYRLLAKIIASRIEPSLPSLIHTDQTGFIKGRYIGQMYLPFFLDFEKAFDTLEWSFLHQALEIFNFGLKITKWVSTLYNDIESGVMNGGYMTVSAR